MIEIGQQVTWTSQAGGSSKTKTGTVLAIVKAGSKAYLIDFFGDNSRILPGNVKAFRSCVKFQQISLYDRVVVEVPRAYKSVQYGVCDYYAPLLSVVAKQNEVTPK